jgi:serine/threonine protein kinase
VKELIADREDHQFQEVAAKWEKEVQALRTMNELPNQNNIVEFVTAFRRCRISHGEESIHEEHYLMFEWADLGNLGSLWEETEEHELTSKLVKDVVNQLWGLSSALKAAHYLDSTDSSIRHGDLKPENILRFSSASSIGTLKIGDWGEAKRHDVVTEMRPSKTRSNTGTVQYQAPEVEVDMLSATHMLSATQSGSVKKPRSRLYDIWAMGCITLEFLIWLLYGPEGLKRFKQDLGVEGFYQITVVNGKKEAQVHSVAKYWMNHMALDPDCEVGRTAIGDVLEIVRDALLVVKLPRRLGTNLRQGRRTDSVHLDSVPRQNNSLANSLPSANSDEVSSESNPIISVTSVGLEADAGPVQHHWIARNDPLQHGPESVGPARCLATEFCHRMEHIAKADEDGSYWQARYQHHSPPSGLPDQHIVASNDTYVHKKVSYYKPYLIRIHL